MSAKTTTVGATKPAERQMKVDSALSIRTKELTRAEMRFVTGGRGTGGTKHSGYDTWGGNKTKDTKRKEFWAGRGAFGDTKLAKDKDKEKEIIALTIIGQAATYGSDTSRVTIPYVNQENVRNMARDQLRQMDAPETALPSPHNSHYRHVH